MKGLFFKRILALAIFVVCSLCMAATSNAQFCLPDLAGCTTASPILGSAKVYVDGCEAEIFYHFIPKGNPCPQNDYLQIDSIHFCTLPGDIGQFQGEAIQELLLSGNLPVASPAPGNCIDVTVQAIGCASYLTDVSSSPYGVTRCEEMGFYPGCCGTYKVCADQNGNPEVYPPFFWLSLDDQCSDRCFDICPGE